MIYFSLNDSIDVQLLPPGHDHLWEWFKKDCGSYGAGATRQLLRKHYPEDEFGWTKFQTWEFMQIFGPTVSMDQSQPMLYNIEVRLSKGTRALIKTVDGVPTDPHVEDPRIDEMHKERAEQQEAEAEFDARGAIYTPPGADLIETVGNAREANPADFRHPPEVIAREKHYEALQALHAACLPTPGERYAFSELVDRMGQDEPSLIPREQSTYGFIKRVIEEAAKVDETIPNFVHSAAYPEMAAEEQSIGSVEIDPSITQHVQGVRALQDFAKQWPEANSVTSMTEMFKEALSAHDAVLVFAATQTARCELASDYKFMARRGSTIHQYAFLSLLQQYITQNLMKDVEPIPTTTR